ncbi:molecular chaperone (plasmid) [Enterobacter asburiae]|uniref:fimbrial biogenesis chaperone n=1 Tax=Enterobacter asburiae TaxID=61645 RepID=UPI0032AFC34F
MKRRLSRYLLIPGCCILVMTQTCLAGVVVGATRLVIQESAGHKDVSLRASGSGAYLVISRIFEGTSLEEGDKASKAREFTVLPPALLMKGGQMRESRIVVVPDNGLARDRETMFYLMVSAIPESSKEKNTVQIAVRTWIKLFYRPASLEGKLIPPPEIARDGDDIVMKNASPFYISLSHLYVQGQPVVSPGDIPPYGEKKLKGCFALIPCKISWMQAKNDNTLNSYELILER